MSTDRILPGIALMLVFCAVAPLLDVAAKLAAENGIPVGQITAARFLVQGALMVPVMWLMGLGWGMTRRVTALVAARAALLILSTFAFVSGIAVMPIADALAIVFVEPFLLLIFGKLLHKDQVGPRRIAASIVGFGGVLLVIQPSLAVFGLVALWPLVTAVSFAAYMLITREVSADLHPVAMQLHTSWIGALMCLPVLLAFDGAGIPALDSVWPTGWNWLWLFGVGFWAAISHMCMTYALKFAPSATLAPLHYLELVAAVALGYLIFDDFPVPLAFAGIAVIMASGLYIVHRERLMHRARMLAPAP